MMLHLLSERQIGEMAHFTKKKKRRVDFAEQQKQTKLNYTCGF